jgi:hypothetical protein
MLTESDFRVRQRRLQVPHNGPLRCRCGHCVRADDLKVGRVDHEFILTSGEAKVCLQTSGTVHWISRHLDRFFHRQDAGRES